MKKVNVFHNAQLTTIFDAGLSRPYPLKTAKSQKNKDISWTLQLPNCPDKICSSEDNQPKDCNNGKWNGFTRANQTYHPNARWCMRSNNSSGPAQQCCYKANGDLITSGLGAGTPDLQAAATINIFQHIVNDVRPFEIAFELDKGSLGIFLRRYLEVRPPNQGGGTCYE